MMADEIRSEAWRDKQHQNMLGMLEEMKTMLRDMLDNGYYYGGVYIEKPSEEVKSRNDTAELKQVLEQSNFPVQFGSYSAMGGGIEPRYNKYTHSQALPYSDAIYSTHTIDQFNTSTQHPYASHYSHINPNFQNPNVHTHGQYNISSQNQVPHPFAYSSFVSNPSQTHPWHPSNTQTHVPTVDSPVKSIPNYYAPYGSCYMSDVSMNPNLSKNGGANWGDSKEAITNISGGCRRFQSTQGQEPIEIQLPAMKTPGSLILTNEIEETRVVVVTDNHIPDVQSFEILEQQVSDEIVSMGEGADRLVQVQANNFPVAEGLAQTMLYCDTEVKLTKTIQSWWGQEFSSLSGKEMNVSVVDFQFCKESKETKDLLVDNIVGESEWKGGTDVVVLPPQNEKKERKISLGFDKEENNQMPREIEEIVNMNNMGRVLRNYDCCLFYGSRVLSVVIPSGETTQLFDPGGGTSNVSVVRVGNDVFKDAYQLFDLKFSWKVIDWICLISGYTGKKSLLDASSVFDKMPRRNGISWNILIDNCVLNGDLLKVQRLFDDFSIPYFILGTAMLFGSVQESKFYSSKRENTLNLGKKKVKMKRHFIEHASRCVGMHNPTSVVRFHILPCQKWFCKWKGNFFGSHIINHLVRAKIVCLIYAKTGSLIILLSREPCFHMNAEKGLNWDLSQWRSFNDGKP